LPDRAEVLHGSLDVLILKALSIEPMHGWGISQRIEAMSRGAFRIGQGSLYPALHRFESRDWVASHWKTTESNRVARYYELTAAGRRALSEETERWLFYTRALSSVLEAG
jgi:PadR family transcriptional regulator